MMKYFAINQISCIFVYQIRQIKNKNKKHYENKNRNNDEQKRETLNMHVYGYSIVRFINQYPSTVSCQLFRRPFLTKKSVRWFQALRVCSSKGVEDTAKILRKSKNVHITNLDLKV